MTDFLTKTLYEKYPKLYVQHKLPKEQTCMCWGFECDDGWFLLLDCLSHLIQTHVDKTGIKQIEAIQVKEKFGGLRFYYSHGDETIRKIVDLFETLSYHVCEWCGSTVCVSSTKSGWIKYLCEKCHEKIKEKENSHAVKQ